MIANSCRIVEKIPQVEKISDVKGTSLHFCCVRHPILLILYRTQHNFIVLISFKSVTYSFRGDYSHVTSRQYIFIVFTFVSFILLQDDVKNNFNKFIQESSD